MEQMERAVALAPRWAMLVDPAAAQSVIERVAKLRLQRRVCRPLDRRREQTENAELARFDAEIDAADETEVQCEEPAEFDAAQSEA